MTEGQATAEFCTLIGRQITKRDRPMFREAWSIFVDTLERGGRISERQASRWAGPKTCRGRQR